MQLQLPQFFESCVDLSLLHFQATEQDDDCDHADRGKTRHLQVDDEPENAGPSTKASIFGIPCASRSVSPAINDDRTHEKRLGAGALNIRSMDQYPCYGISDNGDLTLPEGALLVNSRNSSHVGAEVRRRSLLEKSGFSLVTEKTTVEPAKVNGFFSTRSISRSDNNVDGFAQDRDINAAIPRREAMEESLHTTQMAMDSLHQPYASPTIGLREVAINQDYNESFNPMLPLLPAGTGVQPLQTPQDDPLHPRFFSQLAKNSQVATLSQEFQQNGFALTPSSGLEFNPKVKSRKRVSRTPSTATSSIPAQLVKLPDPSQNSTVCDPLQFSHLFPGMASYNISTQEGGPSQKSVLVQNVRNLPFASSRLNPNSNVDAAVVPRVSPTSMRDPAVPFQFEDLNTKTENLENTAVPEKLYGVTRNQILENERLTRHGRNMVRKRKISTPDHSFVTSAKRFRSESKSSERTRIQPAPQDVNTAITDVQASPATTPTQQMLMKRHLVENVNSPLASHMVVRKFQAQPSFPPYTIPNNASNSVPVGQVYSTNHDWNVRSEDVDLPKRHHCKACLAAFAFKENCERHYKVVHLKRQVFPCPHCTSSYLQPKTMRVHIDVSFSNSVFSMRMMLT